MSEEHMDKPTTVERFGRVDRTGDPGFFLRFVDAANAMPTVRTCKRRIAARCGPRIGHQILDIGCGTGDDARELARTVGSAGRVVGLDNSEAMLAEARRRAEGLGLPLEYRLGDAQRLDWPADTFDVCRTERTFMHLDAPAQAFAEMVRVTRSGGRIVVFDFDWDTLLVEHPDRALSDKIGALITDRLRNGRIGRQLPGLFVNARLADVSVAAHTVLMVSGFFQQLFGPTLQHAQSAGTLTAGEIEAWWAPLDTAARDGRFFSALTGLIVAGTKP
jgi:SAM-dependent methyltransferase